MTCAILVVVSMIYSLAQGHAQAFDCLWFIQRQHHRVQRGDLAYLDDIVTVGLNVGYITVGIGFNEIGESPDESSGTSSNRRELIDAFAEN